MDGILLSGRGLHGGTRCSIEFVRRPGPVRFLTPSGDVALNELSPVRLDRGVRVAAGDFEVELVEHLFAALAGLDVHEGLTLEVVGGEVPLLDGGARELALAIAALGPRSTPPRLRVERAGTLELGETRYVFTPGPTRRLVVEVDFPGVGPQRAEYAGDRHQFLEFIAPARTFGYLSEARQLAARGLARGFDPHAVLVLDDEGRAVPPSAPATSDELARHKLLDFMGDLYLYGGPPLGEIQATRPGHAPTHAALRRALREGLVSQRPS
ncbi:MAG: UDP-3-O-acyl-N-acetylglucosamine deacetylase [Polyangiaceae bacterium]